MAELAGLRSWQELADRSDDVATLLEDHGVRYYRCDVGDWAQVEAARDAIAREVSGPEIQPYRCMY